MREESRRLLTNSIDHVAGAVVGRLQGLRAALQKILSERATTDGSADRRHRLTTINAAITSGWTPAVAAFEEAYRHNAEIAAGWRDDLYGGADLTHMSLKLVDDDQVEWELAFAGAVSRMKSAGSEALAEVEQRAAVLCGTSVNDDFVNPLGLDVVGKGLKAAIENLLPEIGDRRAMLVHFEPLFSREAASLYSELNEALAAAGINLPSRVRSAPSAGRGSGGAGSHGGGTPAAAGTSAAAPSPDSAAGDFMGLIQRLAQSGAGGFGGAGGSGAMAPSGPQVPLIGAAGMPAGMPMMAVPAAMLEALNRLQEIDLGTLQGSAIERIAEGGGNALRELRKQEFVGQLPPIEVATIDIVAMLFDFIFEDKLIPDTVKALAGRLQIPLLKVAMVDKTFFANRQHPARVLLDTISQLSIAAGKGLDHGHPVFERIKNAVNAILTDFEKKPGIFEKLVADLGELLAEQEKLALNLADRSRYVAERQEEQDLAEDLAETRAAEAFELSLKDAGVDEVPAHIADFLSRHWILVLKFAYLKGGAEGRPWGLAVETLNDLLWSVKAKESSEDRQKLVALLPELLRRVNAYFDRVHVDAEQKTPFLNALGDLHFALIKGGRRHGKSRSRSKERGPETRPLEKSVTGGAAATTVSAASSGTAAAVPAAVSAKEASPPAFASISSADLGPNVVVTRFVQEDGLEVESIALAGRILNARAVRASDIANIERGEWVEFIQDSGERVRGRLSWVSPQRGILLFTNPHSSQAISISPEALALQMKRGLATRLDAAEALVDRALGKAMDSMAA